MDLGDFEELDEESNIRALKYFANRVKENVENREEYYNHKGLVHDGEGIFKNKVIGRFHMSIVKGKTLSLDKLVAKFVDLYNTGKQTARRLVPSLLGHIVNYGNGRGELSFEGVYDRNGEKACRVLYDTK